MIAAIKITLLLQTCVVYVLIAQTYTKNITKTDIKRHSISVGNPFITATIEAPMLHRRGKRYLDFLKTTRMFFRVNCKNNIIPKPTIWANGYGFRMNIPIANDKGGRPFRRDTYEIMHILMEKIGFSGKACVLKAFCAAHRDHKQHGSQGILFKLLKYIFTLDSHDKRHFPYLRMENCEQILHSHCPLSFNNISPYTDDV